VFGCPCRPAVDQSAAMTAASMSSHRRTSSAPFTQARSVAMPAALERLGAFGGTTLASFGAAVCWSAKASKAFMCASTTPRRRSAKVKRLPPDRDQPCGRSNRFPATGAAHGRTTFPCRDRGGSAFSISDLHHSAGRRQPVLADLAEQAARLIPQSYLGNAWPTCGPSPAGRRRRRTP
jgi:hypothetical protein